MKLTDIHKWVQFIIYKVWHSYKKYGLWLCILYSFERIGFFKRELIFFELNIEDTTLDRINGKSLEMVRVKKKEVENMESLDGWLTKNEALRWLEEKECVFFAVKDGSKLVCHQWVEFKKAELSPFDLAIALPDKTVYTSHLYTAPEYRGKGLAPTLKLFALQYLKNHGYQRAFLVIAPNNLASQKVNKKVGFKAYQQVLYIKMLGLKYYCVKDCESHKEKVFFSLFRSGSPNLGEIFSKL